MSLLTKEIADLYRFSRKTPLPEKEIIFYAEHEGYFPYFEGLIDSLVGERGKTMAYVTSDPDDPVLSGSKPGLNAFYINKLLPFFMAFVNCRVLVMTMPDLNRYHIKRSANPAHYLYVFHSPVSTHMVYRPGAFDHYDSILCVGPHQVKEIQKYEELHDLPRKVLVEAGYYRLERIHRAYQKVLAETTKPSERATVLVAPSWGDENIFETCGERLVGLLLEAGYLVIARPHPETVRRNPELMKSLGSKFGENPDFTLELSVATDDSLLRADVLISDYSGITLEYAFGTERPVLYLDVPPKVKNEQFGELGIEPLELALRKELGVVVSPQKLETIPAVISDLMAARDDYKDRIARLRKENLYAFGRSSEVGARHILELLSG